MAGRNKRLDERRTDADEQNNTGVAVVDEGGELSSDGAQSGVNITIHNGNSKPDDGKLAKGGDEKPVETKLSEEERESIAKAERARIAEIRKLGTKHGASEELMTRAAEENWSVEKFGLAAFQEKTKGAPPAARIDVGGNTALAELPTALSAAVRLGSGIKVDDSDRQIATKHNLGRFTSARELARFCCAAEGKVLPWNCSDQQLFSMAVSTSSFPLALADSANKSLQAGYAAAPRVFLDIFGRKSVRDFKEYKHLLVSEFSRPGKVGPGGELPHVTFSESQQTYSVDTYGMLFVWTRQMQINDDLGIFTDVMSKLGFAMMDDFDQLGCDKLTESSGVGPTLSDGVAMFATTRTEGDDTIPNYVTGTGTVLKESSLTTAVQTLMKQKHGTKHLNLMPAFALVSPENYHTALRLLRSPTLVPGGGSTSTEMEGTTNIHQGIATPYVSPRLSGKTNGTTAWYLGANQQQYPSLVAVTLNGVETPVIEAVDPGGNILAQGFRCYFDMAWAVVDWRSIVRMKGAA